MPRAVIDQTRILLRLVSPANASRRIHKDEEILQTLFLILTFYNININALLINVYFFKTIKGFSRNIII